MGISVLKVVKANETRGGFVAAVGCSGLIITIISKGEYVNALGILRRDLNYGIAIMDLVYVAV